MIKNIFEVNNEEKSRILNLHESATKRQYISEQITGSSSELIKFTFPFPSEFHTPGGIDGIYDKTHKKVFIQWNNENFELVDKSMLEKDPHNLTDFTWVKDLNERFNNFNNNYFTPSFDGNNSSLVWVEISINRKNKAIVVNTYPTNRKLPQ
jgi:hypothetical protein